jgi:hypothetical protein
MKDKDQEICRDKKKDKEVDKIGKIKEKEKKKDKKVTIVRIIEIEIVKKDK